MKKSLKFLSLLLSLICIVTSFNIGTVFAADLTVNDKQAVVLVLDTSGSMSGSKITGLKSAANKFCQKIIEANAENEIAIVSFASSVKTTDFSSDLSELARTIGNLSASGGTYMASAIASADTLLQDEKYATGYVKSIVTMADGAASDKSATKTNAEALFDSYNMYSIGFISSSNTAAKTLLQNIQNCGYYEADDVDTLIDEFVEIAVDILNPFTLTLSHSQDGDPVENTDTPGSYTYNLTLTAVIKNENAKKASNVKAKIVLDEGMSLSSESTETIDIGVLEAEEEKTVTWNVKCPMIVYGTTVYKQYSVVASSDNTVDISASDKIIFDKPSGKNNELDFSKDIWNFENYTVDKIPLTDEDKNAILYGLSNTEKAYINNFINKPQGGQCYGMAATTVLSKMNIISISNLKNILGANVNCLYEAIKDENAKSLIGYYFITQCFNPITDERAEFNKKTTIEKLADIKTKAQNVSNGANPFIFSFSGTNKGTTDEEGWGHAVVAYAYEAGLFNVNNRIYRNRILIYDNNYPNWDTQYDKIGNIIEKGSEDSSLYFNDDGSWYIPNYPEAEDLTRALSDFNIMDCSDVEINRENSHALLRAEGQTNIKINSSKNSYNIRGNDTTDTTVFYDDGGPGISSALNIILNDGDDTYSVETAENNQQVDLEMKYNNYYMTAESENCNGADFDPSGSVSIDNNKTDYEVSLTGNDGYTSLPWYTITVNGSGTSNPQLTKTNDGYIFEGDELSNITVTGTNDDETKELTFTSEEDKVLIGQSGDKLVVSEDRDNNGTYETVIASSSSSTATEQSGNIAATENNSAPSVTSDSYISTNVKSVVRPQKTKIKNLKSGKKKITVKWKKVKGVKGYQVQVATDKKFKKNKKSVTVKKQKTTKTTIKKLKSNKKYYVRIRTYKVVDGKKVYSKWSKVKTVKTK